MLMLTGYPFQDGPIFKKYPITFNLKHMKTKISDFLAPVHPVFLFATAYLVALTFSVVICISLYNYFSQRGDEMNSSIAKGKNIPVMTAGMIAD